MVSKESLRAKFPAVSVLLPVYNSEKYVAIAIESILQQTLKDFEFIIIDDHSSDNSWEIVKKYAKKDKRIIALRNKHNLKGCNTLNKGHALAKGKYIASIDHDDWSYPDRLEKQFNFMELHPKIGIVGGIMEIINEAGKVVGKRKYHLSDGEIRKNIFRYSPFSHPLIMIRKSILDKIGGYNQDYVPADDYELYFRIGKESMFANLPEVLLQYRVIASSMTHSLTRRMELATFRVRNLYSKDKDYRMTIIDKFLNALQYFSFFIIPSRIRISLFNLLRNTQ
jgi:glycosyltransferase involved in cell wall biosynthesis